MELWSTLNRYHFMALPLAIVNLYWDLWKRLKLKITFSERTQHFNGQMPVRIIFKTWRKPSPWSQWSYFSKPFIIETDASFYVISFFLSQEDDLNKRHPIFYRGRSLSNSERLSTVFLTQKEMWKDNSGIRSKKTLDDEKKAHTHFSPS